MRFEEAQQIAARYGATKHLGGGQESWVFALDDSLILKIQKPSLNGVAFPADYTVQRQRLYAYLNKFPMPFHFPEIYRVEKHGDVQVSIEKRIHGVSLRTAIAKYPDKRRTFITNYYAAVFELAKVPLRIEEATAGVILATTTTLPYILFGSWRDYMVATLDSAFAENAKLLSERGITLTAADIESCKQLLLDDADQIKLTFVHGDFNPENLLVDVETGKITGLLDFSDLTLIGDPRLDLAGALILPEIGHEATADAWPTAEFAGQMRDLITQQFGDRFARLFNGFRLYYALLFAGSEHSWVRQNLLAWQEIASSKELWVLPELRPRAALLKFTY